MDEGNLNKGRGQNKAHKKRSKDEKSSKTYECTRPITIFDKRIAKTRYTSSQRLKAVLETSCSVGAGEELLFIVVIIFLQRL